MTFQEIRQRDVINIRDGKKLGRAQDLIITPDARVEALVMPEGGGFSSLFHKEESPIVIPWECIRRIGDDVILVEVDLPEEC